MWHSWHLWHPETLRVPRMPRMPNAKCFFSMNHRYILEPYKGMKSRFHCPQCNEKNVFTRYIDVKTGQYINDNVGRCNRESNCGYHYKPMQYFLDNPTAESIRDKQNYQSITNMVFKKKTISFIDDSIFKASLKGYDDNCFVKYLVRLFGHDTADEIIRTYSIGTSKHWNGATVFWQIDCSGKIRTGKIMLYDPLTGKRVKEPFNHITWVHSALKLNNYELQQCLFGEHLLKGCSKPVAIVESEKTAIIASVYFPKFIWLATGSLSNLTMEKCSILKNRDVVLFPDLKGYGKWLEKSKDLSVITKFVVSDFLERKANIEEQRQGLDLADYLVQFDHKQFISENIIKPLGNAPTTNSNKSLNTFGELFDFVRKNCPRLYAQMLE